MPYYCTVPRCTSMAGKAKNVSFHQFPRDEELAKLWNRILKRGKPYTKYSKVCSLHFKPEDYTVTSVGKNKGQWRTLRKDAIPSQNLPSDSPVPYSRQHSSAWVPNLSPNLVDPMVQQQMAQAIYMQTMLAMQAAGVSEPNAHTEPSHSEPPNPSPSVSSLSEIELLFRKPEEQKEETYQCQECSKCFKDPDVFVIHKRVHTKKIIEKLPDSVEKENYSANIQDSEETLRANPILANLLKSSMRLEPDFNIEANVLTVENQIMSALASNMEAYIRTLSSMLSSQTNAVDDKDDGLGGDDDAGDNCGEGDNCDVAGDENRGGSDGDFECNENNKCSDVNRDSVMIDDKTGHENDNDKCGVESERDDSGGDSVEANNDCVENYSHKSVSKTWSDEYNKFRNDSRYNKDYESEEVIMFKETYQQANLGIVGNKCENENDYNMENSHENEHQDNPDCDNYVDK